MLQTGTVEADAPVKIASVPDGPIELAVSADAQELRRAFRLVPNQVASVAIKQVRIVGCSDDKNQACSARVEPGGCAGGCALTATDAGEVTLVVGLPKPGVYRASLEVVYVAETKKVDERVEEVKALLATTLQVTRPAPASGALNLVVSGARGADLDLPLTGSGETRIALRLQDDSGAIEVLDKVVATPLVRRSGSDELATVASAVLVDEAAGGGEGHADRSSIPLATAGTPLAIEVSGLDAPGKYEGKLRLSAGQHTTQEIVYTITARRSPWLAALLIALGALLSYGVKFWVGKQRASVVHQRTLQRARERLLSLSPHGERDRALIAALLRELDERLDALENGEAASDDVLARVARRVEVAGDAIRTGQMVERLPLTARTHARGELEAQLAVLRDRAADDTALKAVEAALARIASDSVRRAALGELLGAVETAVAATRGALSPSLQARLAAEVDPPLRSARAATDRGRLDALDAELAKARVALARVQGASLAERWPEAPPKPYEGAPEAYKALRDQLLALLDALNKTQDADEAARLYKEALERTSAAFRGAMVPWLRAVAAGRPQADVAKLEAWAKEVEATTSKPPGDGLLVFDRVLRDVSDMLAGPARVQTSARQSLVPGAAAGALAELPEAQPPVAQAREARWRAARLVAIGDGVVLMAMLLIAVTTGLKLLWVDSATWGGWSDCLNALLWGAGLHAVGNEPFKGLLGLKNDLGKLS